MKIRFNDLCASCHEPAYAHTVNVFHLISDEGVGSKVDVATLEKVNKNLFTGIRCQKFMPDNLKYLEFLYDQRSR
jgi:hypothetical protein